MSVLEKSFKEKVVLIFFVAAEKWDLFVWKVVPLAFNDWTTYL